jgi:cellulose synthase (UDP-forming)
MMLALLVVILGFGLVSVIDASATVIEAVDVLEVAAQEASNSSDVLDRGDRPWIERLPVWQVSSAILLGVVLALLLGVVRWVWNGRSGQTSPATGAVDEQSRRMQRAILLRQYTIRVLILANVVLGCYYLLWRSTASINWAFWPVAIALLLAETYSFIDSLLFGGGMWKWKRRLTFPPKRSDETVDVLITCYNEPVELVEETARAAMKLNHPVSVHICDDGDSADMRRMAERVGCNYIVRTAEWEGKDRHAKAGNLINALDQTNGDFLLILDADQVPFPQVLDETLGYFDDPEVAFVQTPQWFKNVPDGDPFGSQAPLFYGPIQEAKDGWNAAFFCGSNAVVRRDALVRAGLVNYARDLRQQLQVILDQASERLEAVATSLSDQQESRSSEAVRELQSAVRDARRELSSGDHLGEVTYRFQRRAQQSAKDLVGQDFTDIARELAEIPGYHVESEVAERLVGLLDDPDVAAEFTSRETSPLQGIAEIRELLLKVDVDRAFEAAPVMPLSTISVTEDMATAMRLHSLGYKSVYHPTILVHGLAPEDLGTALQQRLRWAQGTIQVMLRENPLTYPGLKPMQRLMYFATMWSYLSGFFAVIYLSAPILYLFFGWTPVSAFSDEFFWRLIPYLIINQALFIVVAWGLPTWRGQQYSLALFPIWIKAVTSAVGSVYLGRKLGFVVTPKTRQQGASLHLIRPQLVFMVMLSVAIVVGLGRLAFGADPDLVPIVVNILWAMYDILALSAVLVAALYRPDDEPVMTVDATAAMVHGRAGTGGR